MVEEVVLREVAFAGQWEEVPEMKALHGCLDVVEEMGIAEVGDIVGGDQRVVQEREVALDCLQCLDIGAVENYEIVQGVDCLVQEGIDHFGVCEGNVGAEAACFAEKEALIDVVVDFLEAGSGSSVDTEAAEVQERMGDDHVAGIVDQDQDLQVHQDSML